MQSEKAISSIYHAILSSLPNENLPPFGLHEPFFDIEEEKNVIECIRTRWVSYQGKFVTEFENKLAEVCGCKFAVAVSSGTVALYMALLASGIRPYDEVLIPSLTFVATANAVTHTGALPHFIDSEYETLGIDLKKLSQYLNSEKFEFINGKLINKVTGNKVTTIIPVHIFGHSIDVDELIKIAQNFNLQIIEDCAEALGSKYKGMPLGCKSGLGILSFNGNKIVTTGGGGAILTNDANLASKIKHLSTTAKLQNKFEFIHDEIGYNFRLPNINAAIGVAQLNKLIGFIDNKRKLANKYKENFNGNMFCDFFIEPNFNESNYWLNAIVLKPDFAFIKDELLEFLHSNSILARPFWRPMHLLVPYATAQKMELLPVAEDLYDRVVCLPSSVFLYE
jgi:perosamine synthetase